VEAGFRTVGEIAPNTPKQQRPARAQAVEDAAEQRSRAEV
jgi:hypothetical protein